MPALAHPQKEALARELAAGAANARAACVAAGYTANTAASKAHLLVRDPGVMARVAELQGLYTTLARQDAERMLQPAQPQPQTEAAPTPAAPELQKPEPQAAPNPAVPEPQKPEPQASQKPEPDDEEAQRKKFYLQQHARAEATRAEREAAQRERDAAQRARQEKLLEGKAEGRALYAEQLRRDAERRSISCASARSSAASRSVWHSCRSLHRPARPPPPAPNRC